MPLPPHTPAVPVPAPPLLAFSTFRGRDGIADLKIACSNTSEGGFTTTGESNEASYYEVDTIAPCGAPPKLYVCLDNHCKPSNMTTAGVPLATCSRACGTEALKYKCTGSIYKKCVPDDNGTAYESCEQACL